MNENLDINLNDVTDGGEPPTDLVGMVSLLGALSDAEREAVLPGFEARVALLTQPRGPASGVIGEELSTRRFVVHAAESVAERTRGRSVTGRPFQMRMAAAVALLGTVLATLVATRAALGPQVGTTGTLAAVTGDAAELERDVERLLSVYAAFDGDSASELATIFDDAGTLGDHVSSRESSDSEWLEESL